MGGQAGRRAARGASAYEGHTPPRLFPAPVHAPPVPPTSFTANVGLPQCVPP